MGSWKCQECGFEVPDGVRNCDGCGYVKYGRLVLCSTETGKTIQISINTAITKRLLHSFAGDDARLASSPQFTVFKSPSEGWAIQHAPGAVNSTFRNGSALSTSAVGLGNGDSISIGPERMKLTVNIED